MSLNLALELEELEECLFNLQELQKNMVDEVKKKNEDVISTQENDNKEDKKSIGEANINFKRDEKTTIQSDTQVCTDLDQLIQMMKQSELHLYNDMSPKTLTKSKKIDIKNDLQPENETSHLKTVAQVKSAKLDQHSQILLNKFGSEKQINYYSSLPKLVPCNEDNFTLIYKSSSQTNLSQPTSDYKIPFTVYQPNRTMKTILIDEFTTAGEICQLLTARNYLMPSIRFSLVEKTSHLKIERIFEDDENPVLSILSYPDGNNKSMTFFEDREDKYGLFTDPGKWLGSSFAKNDIERSYLNEIFDGLVPQLPRYKSHLFYRKINRKKWQRSLCILRNSGLYAIKKSKNNNFADLELIMSLHPSFHLYTTVGGWSQFNVPTPYGFCIKTYGEQNPKYISYFCALSEASLRYWSSIFRIALKGKTLLNNYQTQLEFVSYTLTSFQEMNQIKLLPHLSKSLGCVTGRSDVQTDL